VEILVCVKRVPDTSENEIELNSTGNDIERDELVYSVNEPDNYAKECCYLTMSSTAQTPGALQLFSAPSCKKETTT